MRTKLIVIVFGLFIVICADSEAQTADKIINFSGYEWTVVNASAQGPGPNNWDENNVWVDQSGALHLKITHRGTKWYCAKLFMNDRLGYGIYRFEVIGRIDELDPNVVFGLFNYPPPDVGPDRTHEIDIEFAKWGKVEPSNGQYTVWPAQLGLNRAFKRFTAQLHGTYTTHTFEWEKTRVAFRSVQGHPDPGEPIHEIASWIYQPKDPADYIGEQPMPVNINLWLFWGNPPTDGREVGLVVSSFTFTPK